ncbi:hypothetical protein [Moraxella sp. ZY210820]|uniref:hypothetical protein n=1 Tax=unclassified Moraxella TaxID=2685852 RepID=UPI00272F67CB|nr:hypothetical protein [Moraxella sp. ZY210820]WLF83766.1 hypothetical protein LU301_11055 [Moraxella sp. ZY210820]
MSIYRVVVWADTGITGSYKSATIEIEQDQLPTDEEMAEIFQEHISDIVNSGYYLEE